RCLRVVGRDALRDGLEHHRLAGLGWRHDERALALAERAENVDDAIGEVGLALANQSVFQAELFVGMDRTEAGGIRTAAESRGWTAKPADDPLERRTAAFPTGPTVALDLVAGTKLVLANEPLAHVDVAPVGEIAGLAAPEEPVAAHQLENARHQ